MAIAIDTSVLVGLINPRDIWRTDALNLQSALLASGEDLLYFDCAVAEAISVVVR